MLGAGVIYEPGNLMPRHCLPALLPAILAGMICGLAGCQHRVIVEPAAPVSTAAISIPDSAVHQPPASPATFSIPQSELHEPLTLVAYGDMRFTDPSNTTATNPVARRALIDRIAAEHPDALFLNGDVPYIGGNPADYAQFHLESSPWRDAGLRVYPALGNHEFKQCAEQVCLENWWAEFPQLQRRRWYSVQLGDRLRAIALDTDAPLVPGSEQMNWLAAQLAALPPPVRFVLIWMHHPVVSDGGGADSHDDPRPNEIALRDFLKNAVPASAAQFLVVSAHIHNYERFSRDGIAYLVSGGGGAKPTPVTRGPDDLYQDNDFPNFHYLKLVLEGNRLSGTMFRLDDPAASMAHWSVKDRFDLIGK
jgi:hypothetical protein